MYLYMGYRLCLHFLLDQSWQYNITQTEGATQLLEFLSSQFMDWV